MAGAASAQTVGSSGAGNTLQEVIVTGSRIPRPNLEQATPVTVLSPQMIDQAGPKNLGDIIAELPSVGVTATVRANSNNFGNTAGISSIDLRNLGTSRTLVLVDGQRHVNGDVSFNAVDLNTIPQQLVDRVEVITGGASAIYGSDAVSGVVNIIMKKNFEGLQLDAQAGSYDNYGAKYSVSGIAGRNFMDDRLNVTVAGWYNKENGIAVRDVSGAHNYATVTNPNDLSGPVDPTFFSSPGAKRNDRIPDNIFVQNVGSEVITPNGTLLDPNTSLPITLFDARGNPVPVPQRLGFNNFVFGALPGNCVGCYFFEDLNQEQSPIQNEGVNLRMHYDVTPHLHANLDAKLVQVDVQNAIQASNSIFEYQLTPDNPFITPAIAALLPPASDPADFPFVSEFIQPNGRTQDIHRRTYRVVFGLNGDFDAGFANVNWDGALNYGKVTNRIRNNSLEITANFHAAIDSVIDPATGQAACRINVPSAGPSQFADAVNADPGCVPFNPFAPGRNSAQAFNYSFGVFDTHDTLSQEVADLNFNFDTGRFLNLQGGPIGVALGGEYRMERTKDVNDPRLVAGDTESLFANSSGGFNVKEGYIELNLPILKDFRPLLYELSADVAYRLANYSTSGTVGAYKFSADYAPSNWLKFRGTYSRSIRAPNITEAFEPLTPGFFQIVDPCSQENITNNVNFAKNCAAAGIPAGFSANNAATIKGQSSGNPNLDPEKSISYTAGLIFQPPGVPGLAITLDYYAIKIKNAITQVLAQDIINNCFSGPSLDPTFCSLFTRGPDQNINFVQTTFVNASKLFTEGYELHVSYTHDVSPVTERWRYTQGLTGNLTFDLAADYLVRLRNFPFQANPAVYHVLEGRVTNVASLTAAEGTPRWKGVANTTYKQGPVTVNWQVRYVGKGALYNVDPTSVDRSEALNIPFAKSVFYHDIEVRYALGDQYGRWLNGLELFAGVNDVFGDRAPFETIGQGNDVAYDLGRFYFGGFRYRR
ncbi:TonB-dependent receptor plug domain-containing protein [Phenylobacterium sp.]|uniref:TonB-dependent receptor plug domain-containing protein n=1 Tax=Phenylobacterium sp. TaxID=1871053 RepID=UPI002D7F4343|nr:TonB-dependent receptor [Phenylobacterium sp.]